MNEHEIVAKAVELHVVEDGPEDAPETPRRRKGRFEGGAPPQPLVLPGLGIGASNSTQRANLTR